MITWMRERLAKDESGFTLIELMVVVLIIAILIAIAIPTFLGARERAQDRGVQSNLRNGLTAEKVYYTDNETYTTASASLEGIEPSLAWNAGSAADTSTAGEVFVAVGGTNDQNVCLTALSQSGTLFYVKDIATGTNAGTWYTTYASGSAPACDNANAGMSADGW